MQITINDLNIFPHLVSASQREPGTVKLLLIYFQCNEGQSLQSDHEGRVPASARLRFRPHSLRARPRLHRLAGTSPRSIPRASLARRVCCCRSASTASASSSSTRRTTGRRPPTCPKWPESKVACWVERWCWVTLACSACVVAGWDCGSDDRLAPAQGRLQGPHHGGVGVAASSWRATRARSWRSATPSTPPTRTASRRWQERRAREAATTRRLATTWPTTTTTTTATITCSLRATLASRRARHTVQAAVSIPVPTRQARLARAPARAVDVGFT